LQNFTLITTTVAELYTLITTVAELYTLITTVAELYTYNNCCRTLHL